MELKQGYKQTEIGLIPTDWEVKELGEIGTFKNGINKSNEDFGFGYPFVNLMDVFGKSSISRNENFGLINSNEIERKLYDLKKGDVLFIRSSVKPSGVGLTCVIENHLPNIIFSGFIIRYRDNNYLHDGYKRHCFYDERFRNNLIGSSTVSANTNINQEALKKLKISIPPTKEEQIAIATALSDIDELISQTEKLIDKKKAIKQGVMQELLEPKEGWVTKKLGELATCYSGGTPSTFKREYWGGDIAWLPSGRVKNNIIKQLDTEITITEQGLNCSAAKLITPNSVLIAITGATCGNIGLLTFSAAANQSVVAVEANIETDNKLIYYKLLSMRDDILRLQTGSAQGGVNLKAVKSIEITIPKDKKEQGDISQILYDFEINIENQIKKLKKLKLQKQGMMQALLTGKIRLI